MFRTARTSILALLVVAAGVTAHANSASAASATGRYGVTTINNKTQGPVKLAYRNGTGDWKIRTLQAGDSLKIWYQYPTDFAVSPQLQVMMDVDMTAASMLKTFNLERYVVTSVLFSGKIYNIRYTSTTYRFVSLYSPN